MREIGVLRKSFYQTIYGFSEKYRNKKTKWY